MTPKELKNSILQLAIEGKLVEQRKEEGTAEILYAEIQKEKQKLIKQGKIKKEKELPEITDDEIPFEIPKSWKWVRLDNISEIITKGTTPRGGNVSYTDKGVMFLRAENVAGYDKLDITNVNYVNKETHEGFLKRSILQNNDILITIAGTLGRTALVKEKYLPLNVNQAISIVRLIKNIKFNYKFIIFALNSTIIQKKLIVQKKITAIPNLTLEIISNCIVPLPSLDEQKRIVEKIEELMPLVDRYEVLYNRLNELNKEFPKKLKNAVLQKAIEGKLVPQIKSEGSAEDLYKEIQKEKQKLIKQGKIKKEKELPEITEDEIPFEIPKSWKWCRLKNITYNVGNKTNQIQSKNIREKGKYPVVSQGQKLIDGYFDDSKKLVSDLPLVMFGDHTRNVKYIDFRFIIGADGTKFLKTIGFDTKYLFHWVKLIAYSLRDRGYARHFGLLCEELFPLPPLAEQKRIVEKIEEILPNIEKFENIMNKEDK